jgi:hypothetical protein
MRDECVNGHRLHSSVDVFADGDCRHCDKVHQGTYRSRRQVAMELMRALESHGLQVARSDPPFNIRQLAAALVAGIDSKPD